MKVFDVVGTTTYADFDLTQIDTAEKDCEKVVLPAMFGDMHMCIGQCELADDATLYESGLPIDWIVTVIAQDENDVESALPHANEVGKQYSYLYEVSDVTDEVGGVQTYLNYLYDLEHKEV